MTTLLDSNVIISIFNQEERHHIWASEAVEACKLDGPAVITNVIYCEISVAIDNQQELDDRLDQLSVERIPEDSTALFRAGKAFLEYRRNGGTKNGVLPDLFIGAVALMNDTPLITADTGRYKTYFPEVKLITPF